MNRLTLLILVIASTAYSQTKWGYANPLPQGDEMNAICMPDSTSYIIAGNRGTFIRVDTGFKNWYVWPRVAGIGSVTDVAFLHKSRGVAVSRNNVVLTSDGGRSWIPQTDNVPSLTDWSRVVFRPDGVPFTVGGMNIIASSDGGRTWSQQQSDTSFVFTSIHFTSKKIGYISGGAKKLLKTTDGGKTWFKLSSELGPLGISTVHFFSNDTGIVIGNGGVIFKTYDGGNNWTKKTSGITNHLRQIVFLNNQLGFIFSGTIVLMTTDAGETWKKGSNLAKYVQDVIKDPFGRLLAVTDSQIYVSKDSAKSWVPILSSRGISTDYFTSVDFSQAGVGFAGGQGLIIKSTDKGKNWSEILRNDSITIESVDVLNDSTVVATRSPSVLKSSDGGRTWTMHNTGAASGILMIKYVDSSKVVISAGGSILYSNDGGETWQPSIKPPTESIFGLDFANSNIGYAASTSKQILKTTDGGIHWDSLLNAPQYVHLGISCLDPNNLVVVSRFGVVSKSTDGGLSWKTTQRPTGDDPNQVIYVDQNTISIIGSGPYVSTDGGETWPATSASICSGPLFSAHYFDKDTAVVVGANGNILYCPYLPSSDTSWYPPYDTAWNPPLDTTAAVRIIGSNNLTLRIIRNPASDFITFSLDSDPSTATLSIYDITGRKVEEQFYGLEEKIVWNASNVRNGPYFFKIIRSGEFLMGKFTIYR